MKTKDSPKPERTPLSWALAPLEFALSRLLNPGAPRQADLLKYLDQLTLLSLENARLRAEIMRLRSPEAPTKGDAAPRAGILDR